MAKRRKRAKKNPTTRRIVRRNPSPRKVVRRVSSAFGGLSFRKTLKDVPATQVGMFAAKWAAKRLGSDASETDPESWTAMSYVKGALGAVGAALLVNQLNRGAGQTVLDGGVNLMIFKALQNEVIAGSDWASAQFGQEYVPDEYAGLAGAGAPLMLAADGNEYPADDSHRFSDSLEPVGPLGDSLEPVGPLGADPYAAAFQS